jgi:hypothetical protein
MKAKHYVGVLTIGPLLFPALWAVELAAEKPGGALPPPTMLLGQRETLRGLQGIGVIVDMVRPEAEQLGLTREALQTDTDLQLRQYGIKVVSFLEMFTTPGVPVLYINANVKVRPGGMDPIAAVSIVVQLKQNVSLDRDPTIRCKVPTWESAAVATVGRANIRQVRAAVRDLVARFINDYLVANPKQPAPTPEGGGSEAKQG